MPDPGCKFPDCPSGLWTTEIRDRLKLLHEGQDKQMEALTKLGAIQEGINNLHEKIEQNQSEHNEIWLRLRLIEEEKVSKSDVFKIMGLVAITVTLIEVVFRWLHSSTTLTK